MGVHGLWRLIEPSGKPVPVESLENKVLAVDVSIWLHQAIKGFQDAKGAPAVNAHLLGIFHRVCKLLYFKVKPIFVFDGGVPVLKRETIARRNKLKHKNISEADKLQKQLLSTLIKHTAVNKVLGEKAKAALEPTKQGKIKEPEDLFKLPEKQLDSSITSSDDEDLDEESSQTDSGSPTKHWNLHNIDTKSDHFRSLPADVRHEILSDLKDTRKQSSWGRLHELPTKSDDFSGFQMKRLLKRQEVQAALDEAAQEMGGQSLSLAELEEILKDQGVISKNTVGSRIASDENTRYLYIRNVKEALEKARKEELKKKLKQDEIKDETKSGDENEKENTNNQSNKADLEFKEDLEKAIVLSLQDQPSSSGYSFKKKLSEYSFLENFNDEDFQSDDSSDDDLNQTAPKSKLTLAQNYMMEYSGLNPNEISKIIKTNEGLKPAKRKVNEMVEKNKESVPEVIIDQENKKLKINIEDTGPPLKKLKQTEIEEEKITGISSSEESDGDFEEVKTVDEDFEEVKTVDGDKNQISLEKVDITPNKPESGDSDSDFVEVENNSSRVSETQKNILEIKIETEKFEEDDDLFSDIFTTKTEVSEVNKKEEMDDEIIPKTAEGEVNKALLEYPQVPDAVKDEKSLELSKNETNNPESRSDLLKELMEKANKIKDKNDNSKLTEEDLKNMRNDLSEEQLELRNEQGLRERLGTNITDQMYKEAQDLLELFGLPYVIAPMEAEAQCAFLESVSLTDGTITDDSDIWLFGGKTVYKNFFNQSKHVLEYRAEDIKHHFKLSREQMILLALLVGSDYTVGLQGVGPVTALEILAAFPSSNSSSFTLSHNQLLMGLSEFKSWLTNGKSIARGKNSLRNKLKNITISEGFPSVKVVQAYLDPTVDKSEEKFTWSRPDLVGLVDFGRSKFGWTETKTEEILKPVLKRLKETKYQSTLLNYFQIKHNLTPEQAEKLMSERVKSAVKRIGQDPNDEEDFEEIKPKKVKKPKKKSMDEEKKSKKKVKKSVFEDKRFSSDEEFIEIDKLEAILEEVENDGKPNQNIEDTKDQTKKKSVRKPRKKKEIEVVEPKDEVQVSTEDVLSTMHETPITKVESKTGNIKRRKGKINKKLEDRELKINETEESIESSKNPIKNVENHKPANIRKKKGEILGNSEVNELKSSNSNEHKISISNSETTIQDPSEGEKSEVPTHIGNINNTDIKLFNEIIKHQKNKESQPTIKENRKKRPQMSGKAKTQKANVKGQETDITVPENFDEELKLLRETEVFSEKRLEDIHVEAEKQIEAELNKKKLITRRLHKKEVIPQRVRDQKNLMRTRLKAIEVFRKSKIDPTSKKGGAYKLRAPKEDAELSEDSSDSDL